MAPRPWTLLLALALAHSPAVLASAAANQACTSDELAALDAIATSQSGLLHDCETEAGYDLYPFTTYPTSAQQTVVCVGRSCPNVLDTFRQAATLPECLVTIDGQQLTTVVFLATICDERTSAPTATPTSAPSTTASPTTGPTATSTPGPTSSNTGTAATPTPGTTSAQTPASGSTTTEASSTSASSSGSNATTSTESSSEKSASGSQEDLTVEGTSSSSSVDVSSTSESRSAAASDSSTTDSASRLAFSVVAVVVALSAVALV